MKTITKEQYELLHPHFPVQRGNVRISNLTLINALLYIAENGCKWRSLPKEYGNWHTVYMRLRRWSEAGVLETLIEALQEQDLVRVRVEAIGLSLSCLQSLTVSNLEPTIRPFTKGVMKLSACFEG